MRLRGALMAMMTAAPLAVGAQPPGNTAAPVDTPTGPQALPGDYFDLPQSAQLRVPIGPPPGRNPHLAPGDRGPAPGPTPAAVAAQTALDSCSADGYTVAVAVTDAAGNLRAALAPPGTRPNGVFMAMHKAVAVVGLGMPTLDFRMRLAGDPSLMARVKPNMALLPGGVPIMDGDRLVGAIATSGASAHEEEKCARDGIASIRARLADFR